MAEPDYDDSEWSEAIRWLRDVRSREYASYWTWEPDRKVSEREVARVLQNFLRRSGEASSGQISSTQSDPPDVLLTTSEGRLLGIEVTELVDGDVVRRHRERKKAGRAYVLEYSNWTREKIATEVGARVRVKDKKIEKALARTKCRYDELILVIATDDPAIDERMIQDALALCQRKATTRIDRAFIMMSPHPRADEAVYPDKCVVLSIPLSRA